METTAGVGPNERPTDQESAMIVQPASILPAKRAHSPMADQETNYAPPDSAGDEATVALTDSNGYSKRQVGLIGIMLMILGVIRLGSMYDPETNAISVYSIVSAAIASLFYVMLGLGFLWIEVSDQGDYLLVASGPCRWTLCGCGKEKVKYSEIRDFGTVKTCWYTLPWHSCCSGVRVLNQCSCCQCACCGPAGSLQGDCCGQRTIRLTVKERMFGHQAFDDEDCCLENLCLRNCLGRRCADECMGGVCGEGCCFATCFNPCGANCVSMNTMYISTNDPEGLIHLLESKTDKLVTL